jgi:PAS domain S-box-containing protein
MKLSTRLTVAMVALVLLTAAAIGALNYRNVTAAALPRALDRIETHVQLIAAELEASVRGTRADVTTQGRAVDGVVSANIPGGRLLDELSESQWRARLAARFVAELNAKPSYALYRLVGVADGGKEIVRVDRRGPGGAVRIVPDNELQRRGEEDYFKAAIALPAGVVHVSPVALLREQGLVAAPPVPLLRVAAPVMAPDGSRFGLLIINVDLRSASSLVRSAALPGGQVYVVSDQGDYLVHPDASREFGFEREKTERVGDDFAELAGLSAEVQTGSRIALDHTTASFGVGWKTVRLAGGPLVSVVETEPYAELMAATSAIRESSAIGGGVAALGAVIIAVLLARSLTKPLVAMTAAVEAFGRDERPAVPLDARGETGVLAKAFDRMANEVRERTEAQRDSERLAQAIIDTALDAFIQSNEAGIITDWNSQAEAVFGWSRQEAVGQEVGMLLIAPPHRERYLEQRREFLDTLGETALGQRFQYELVRRDGKVVKVEVAMTALYRGGVRFFNAFVRDITEKIAAEEQLRQAQKMEAVGQLTGGIAHDFNNMLTVITGTIDILAAGVADRPELAAIAKLIGEASDRGAELTARLLAFARKQPLNPQETDINALLAEAVQLLRPTLGAYIEIESKLEENAWPALIDPIQLTTALVNLGVNARDAMPDGGRLTLETSNVMLDESYPRMNVDVTAGPYVMIAVSDTGAGIPEAIREKVFEPFFSTKEVGKGTGLGLSMVYGFVKQSGGHIKVYSEEGHGTTIRLYLPRAAAALDRAVEPARNRPIAGGNETILIVEDDEMVRNFVIAQISGLGYATLDATNGAEALALIDAGVPFDLLFTDMMMPGPFNGRKLAEEAAKRRPGIRVLFTTGYTENAVIHHGRLDPGVLLLAKPYSRSDLAQMLRNALDGEAATVATQASELRAG